MEKLITLITLTFAGVSAFAITDEQKAEFINSANTQIQNGDAFMESVQNFAKTEIAYVVAKWADENTEEYQAWLNSNSLNNNIKWTVRVALGNKLYEVGSLRDAVIDDYRSTYDEAVLSEDFYNEIKAKNFIVAGGEKMSDSKIWMLAKTHCDVDLIITKLPEKFVAEHLGELLKIVRKAKLDAEKNYKILSQIAQTFAQYRDTVDAVKNNWEALQNDKNEAFMAYYADQKLKSLNK
jgi:hypothetical protein